MGWQERGMEKGGERIRRDYVGGGRDWTPGLWPLHAIGTPSLYSPMTYFHFLFSIYNISMKCMSTDYHVCMTLTYKQHISKLVCSTCYRVTCGHCMWSGLPGSIASCKIAQLVEHLTRDPGGLCLNTGLDIFFLPVTLA